MRISTELMSPRYAVRGTTGWAQRARWWDRPRRESDLVGLQSHGFGPTLAPNPKRLIRIESQWQGAVPRGACITSTGKMTTYIPSVRMFWAQSQASAGVPSRRTYRLNDPNKAA